MKPLNSCVQLGCSGIASLELRLTGLIPLHTLKSPNTGDACSCCKGLLKTPLPTIYRSLSEQVGSMWISSMWARGPSLGGSAVAL